MGFLEPFLRPVSDQSKIFEKGLKKLLVEFHSNEIILIKLITKKQVQKLISKTNDGNYDGNLIMEFKLSF